MKNVLIPVKEADIKELLNVALFLIKKRCKIVFWSYMPHEKALMQSEYLTLLEFCLKHNVDLVHSTQDDLDDAVLQLKSDYFDKIDQAIYRKAFFSVQYFTKGFFDRSYGPKMSHEQKVNVFNYYIEKSLSLINEFRIDTIINFEENTEPARAALGVCEGFLGDLKYLTIRRLESGKVIILEGYKNQIPIVNKNNTNQHYPFNMGSAILKRSIMGRLYAHLIEIYNTVRYFSKSFKLTQNKLSFVGNPLKRVLKTIQYMSRDIARYIFKRAHEHSTYQVLYSIQTYPETSSITDGFPNVSLYGNVIKVAAYFLSSGRLAVVLHPNSDYEVPLSLERKLSKIPNVDVYNYWHGRRSADFLTNDVTVITGSGNFGIAALLSGYIVIFTDTFWLTRYLDDAGIDSLSFDPLGVCYFDSGSNQNKLEEIRRAIADISFQDFKEFYDVSYC